MTPNSHITDWAHPSMGGAQEGVSGISGERLMALSGTHSVRNRQQAPSGGQHVYHRPRIWASGSYLGTVWAAAQLM